MGMLGPAHCWGVYMDSMLTLPSTENRKDARGAATLNRLLWMCMGILRRHVVGNRW